VIGKQWQTVPISPAAWSTAGTGGTTAGTNFIGTTDANDFVVKTNNRSFENYSAGYWFSDSSFGLLAH
jgi:hypothetical protein